MNRRICASVPWVVLLLMCVVAMGLAEVPQRINYQVMLTDDSNEPMSEQVVELVFGIWTAADGGTPLWTETHNTTTNSIGVASVMLGSVVPLSGVDFSVPLWLEITVDAETLSPRRELVSSPYALCSADIEDIGEFAGVGLVEDGSNRLKLTTDYETGIVYDGRFVNEVDMPVVVRSVDGVVNDGGDIDLVAGSNVTITPDDAANTITIAAEGGDDGDWVVSGSDVYRTGGNVGIGTATPNSYLHVHADAGCGWQLTNPTTGSTAGDGFQVTVDGSGHAYLQQKEPKNLYLRTQNNTGIKVYDIGSVAVGDPSYADVTLNVGGTTRMDGFQLPTGASDGYVLTCNASGEGTWEAPAAGDDGDWIVSGSDVYRTEGSVGIGTSWPHGDLHIHEEFDGAGTGLWMTTETGGTGLTDGLEISMSPSGYTFIQQHEEASMFLGVGSEQLIALTPENRVGIGTLSPASLLHVSGETQMGGFKMPTGASAGHVLTSDGSGVGTWQAPPSGPDDGDWSFGGGSNVYKTTGNVGIGTASPQHDLHIESSEEVPVRFASDYSYYYPRVLEVEYTGTISDAAAISGNGGVGQGGFFYGGTIGLEAASAGVTGWHIGVLGRAVCSHESPSSALGVYGSARDARQNYGVFGEALSWDVGDTCIAVYGTAWSGAGTNYAGYFAGDVGVCGNLSKGTGSFKIDHPLDPEHKYLYHSFVESPDMMNIYNGNVILESNGSAWVELPDWFEALNRDFRYQLTAIGAPGPNLYVADTISGNRFRVAGGEPGMTVSWQVTGVRHDPLAEARRIPVEEDKAPAEVGKYMYPEVYGEPRESGIGYRKRPEAFDRPIERP
ncbi:MAG: hypothetical protein JXB46_03915 [Candidatus Eisenbacteria bacterium]|nr:hypothetical protein [Candidatus Eisenbacteria bacterium]